MPAATQTFTVGDRVFIDPHQKQVPPRLRGVSGTIVSLSEETVCLVWHGGSQSATVLVEHTVVRPERRRPNRKMN